MNMDEITAALEAMTRLSRYVMENASKEQLTDTQILSCKILLTEWKAGEKVEEKYCRRHGDKVYRCRQAHTTQTGWEPDETPAMWAVIDVTHAGTISDPIPASVGMEYVYGKYYFDPADNKTYLCTRAGTVDGETITLYYLPHELVGQYFELA